VETPSFFKKEESLPASLGPPPPTKDFLTYWLFELHWKKQAKRIILEIEFLYTDTFVLLHSYIQ
jgi:hypothetical protein